MGYLGHLDELQKAEIVSKSKLVPSVIKTHLLYKSQVMHFIIKVVVTNRFHGMIYHWYFFRMTSLFSQEPSSVTTQTVPRSAFTYFDIQAMNWPL